MQPSLEVEPHPPPIIPRAPPTQPEVIISLEANTVSDPVQSLHTRSKSWLLVRVYTHTLPTRPVSRSPVRVHTHTLPTRPINRSLVRVHTHKHSAYKTREQVASQSTHTHKHPAYKTHKQVAGQNTHTQAPCPRTKAAFVVKVTNCLLSSSVIRGVVLSVSMCKQAGMQTVRM